MKEGWNKERELAFYEGSGKLGWIVHELTEGNEVDSEQSESRTRAMELTREEETEPRCKFSRVLTVLAPAVFRRCRPSSAPYVNVLTFCSLDTRGR